MTLPKPAGQGCSTEKRYEVAPGEEIQLPGGVMTPPYKEKLPFYKEKILWKESESVI